MASNVQIAAPAQTDWPSAAKQLKDLAAAEAKNRPSENEYDNRTNLEAIPLLALDCEHHEQGVGRSSGIWTLNHSQLDDIANQYLEIASRLGAGLPGRPEAIDPLTFLLHNMSLWLWRTEDRQAHFRYLKLPPRPLLDNRSIQSRQIVSLIKATELYARQRATIALQGSASTDEEPAAFPWLLVQEDKPEPQGYPGWFDLPDGRRWIAKTRADHAGLFAAGWIAKNVVSVTKLRAEPTVRPIPTLPLQPATPNPGAPPAWSTRLRRARESAQLTRPALVQRLKQQGVDITADAIKKHEEGKATPRPDTKAAYAIVYRTSADQLFSGE